MNVATPSNELLDKLTSIGWTLKKIDFKQGVYVAKADNEVTGQDIERSGKTPEMALASVLRYAQRAYATRRTAALIKYAAWDSDWLDQADDIGTAYAKMPVFDEKAVPAWKALAAESKIQADAIQRQIQVEVVDDPEPYMSAQEMVEDIHKNKHFTVSRANSEHPIWSPEDNINFRIVHDVLGHAQSGGDFSWVGENKACGVHFPLVSPLAREALFTECIGQQAYYRKFHGFGPQKVGFLSQFLHPVQEKQGEHVWVPHGGIPELQAADNMSAKGTMDQAPGMQGIFNSPGDWVQPSQYVTPQVAPPSPVMGPSAVMQGYKVQTSVHESKDVSPDLPHDPNHFYTPQNQVPPLQGPDQDYIGIGDTVSNAAKINTEWWNEDPATQDKAIMNAFKVAILSPRKHLKWNAAHYQALMHADPGTKAIDMWDMLEKERERHNQALGYPEGSHLAYSKQLKFLAHELQTDNPDLSDADANKEAKETIFNKIKEFEAALGNNPEYEGTSELKRYNAARKLVTEWLRENYTPLRGWQEGQTALAKSDIETEIKRVAEKHMPEGGYGDTCWNPETKTVLWIPADWTENDELDAAHEAFLAIPGVEKVEGDAEQGLPYKRDKDDRPIKEDDKLVMEEPWIRLASLPPRQNPALFEQDEWQPVQDASGFAAQDSKYGAFMGGHLDAIEKVGQHIDEIREAAMRDLEEDNGKGFIFRNTVMNMNLPGVNPKVASFVWLLLNPMASELGIIDTHVLRGLRRNEKDATVRDYYKLERMQRAAKDGTGYSHVPLGLYHWGLWDQIRNPGAHSDHTPLRVLDPLPWKDAHWDAASNAKSGPWVGPLEFENARPHMEQAASDFDTEMQGQPHNKVPLAASPFQTTSFKAPVL